MKINDRTIAKALTSMSVMVIFLLFIGIGCSNNSDSSAVAPVNSNGSTTESQVLARVEIPGDISEINLPVYALLEDNQDVYYALVISTESEMKNAGVTYKVISEHLAGADYILGESGRTEAYEEVMQTGKVIYNDRHWIIARYEPDLEATLSGLDFDLLMLSKTPMAIYPKEKISVSKTAKLTKIEKVQQLMDRIQQSEFDGYIKDLSGENEVTVGDKKFTIKTRHTEKAGKDEGLTNAISYVTSKLDKKVTVTEKTWTAEGNNPWTNEKKKFSASNIIGEMPGKKNKKEIVVLIAHLDSVSGSSSETDAPGADDDGSGSAALLTVARNIYDCSFDRTIRFVFTTGEEQGVLGGNAYVDSLAADDKVVAAINLDMIAYTGISGDTTRTQRVKIENDKKDAAGYANDLPLASLYRDVVTTYGLSNFITVEITPDGELNSDQAPFWHKKLPAIWLLENDYDYSLPTAQASKYFNKDNMHSTEDKLSKCITGNYYTSVVKALLGTTAHQAGIQIP